MATSIRYGTAATKDGVYDTYAEFLDSGGAAANPGPVWIGKQLIQDSRFVFDRLPGFVMIGDSTIALGTRSGSITNVTATIGAMTAQMNWNSHGMSRGARFVLQNTNHAEFTGVFTVASIVSANAITFALTSPATVSTSTGAGICTTHQRVKDSEYCNISNFLSGHKGLYLGNFAQGASFTANLDRQLDLALNPANNLWNRAVDIVFMATGINDATTDVSSTVTIANIEAAITRIIAADAIPVLISQFPLSNTATNWSIARSLESRKVVAYFRNKAATDKTFVFIDAHDICVDRGNQYGNWISGYSSDGVHPAKKSALPVAKLIKSQFWDSILSSDDRALTPMIANTTMTGTSGTVSGTGASGSSANTFTVTAAGAGSQTIVASKGLGLSGSTESQRLAVTAAAANDNGNLKYGSLHASITPGDKFVFRARIRTTDSGLLLQDLTTAIWTYIDATTVGYGAMDSYESGMWDEGIDLMIETPLVEFQSGCTNFAPEIRIRWSAAASGTFDISEFQIYKVN